MENIGALKVLALSGGAWVVWMLMACSVLVVAVMAERWWMLRQEQKSLQILEDEAMLHIEKGNMDAASKTAHGAPGAAANILLAGLKHMNAGLASLEEHVTVARLQEKKRLENRLLILGTLGNNAPFIGLFGTVLGIIKAFHDLANQVAAGPEVVMQGLSEALIATAVGLLVAIPAVVSFNFFQKRVNDLLVEAESLARILIAHLKDESKDSGLRRRTGE